MGLKTNGKSTKLPPMKMLLYLVMFYKDDNFCDFLFAFLFRKSLLKRGLKGGLL